MLGWCIDANDLESRLGKDLPNIHKACKHGVHTTHGVLQCNCWCHTSGTRPSKRISVKRKKVYVEQVDSETNPVPKKRGRPKGSKNKPKPVTIN